MDTHPLAIDAVISPGNDHWWQGSLDTLHALWGTVTWMLDHALWLAVLGIVACACWTWVEQYLAAKALAQRTYLELVPSRQFVTTPEEILRFGAQLIRAAGAGTWWTPRSARTVRIRLRADGSKPLAYRLEGPASARDLLLQTPYHLVRTESARPVRDKARSHTVRSVFTLHGNPGSRLRDVPLEPDPLQPLIDAVADLRKDQGDLAEVCIDVSPASKWRIRARRWQVMNQAREQHRKESRREARGIRTDAAQAEDSLAWQISKWLAPEGQRGGGEGQRLLMAPRPPHVDRDKALGKLVDDNGLVRVQLLVRCASNADGREERRLRHIEAALDVFGARARFSSSGWSLGPLRVGPDRWPWRKRFDARWTSGLIRPGRNSWARIEELGGLLKPPTLHARLPLLAGDIPTWRRGKDLLPQGIYRGPVGKERIIATREAETLFETQVGKAGWGKTERALVQAVAVAHNGGGLAFIDPHRDSLNHVAPYLAHNTIMSRLWLIDLTAHAPGDRLACWNPLSMTAGQAPHEVVTATVDAFASSLGWGDANAPRAITILTKAVEALVALNAAAVAARAPDCQATIFQIRPLLSDPSFRDLVVARLDDEAAQWWQTSFDSIPKDALPTVLNPLDRLSASPVIKAFLGQPVGSYDIRRAMDDGNVVWICPPGTGPTNRLLVSLIVRDILRAGLSRRDTPEKTRRPFRVYLDELISLDGAASQSLAEITEQLRKFAVRLHGMTQSLDRLQASTRTALLQNASSLSTTAGSVEAIRHITNEWNGQVTPESAAELPRFHHWASFTVAGNRVGPLLMRGPTLDDVHGGLARPKKLRALQRAADTNTAARPLNELTAAASTHQIHVTSFLAGRQPGTTQKAAGSGRTAPTGRTSLSEQRVQKETPFR